MNKRELRIGIQQVFVVCTAADQGQSARRCPAKIDFPFQIRIVGILYSVHMVNLDQVAEPVPQPLKNGYIPVGKRTLTDRKIANIITPGLIKLDKIRCLRRIRLHRFLDLFTACLIQLQAIVIEPDIIQIAKLLPGVIDIFRLLIRLTAQFAVNAVLKKDVLPRNARKNKGEHNKHDNQNGYHGPEKTLQDIPFHHKNKTFHWARRKPGDFSSGFRPEK